MAQTNIREFTLGLERFKDRAEERRRDLTKTVALRALNDLVLGTRVDTGRARGNWQVGEVDYPEGHDPTLGAVGGRDDGTIAQRVDPLAVGGQEILARSGAEVIRLHNGVPYIGILEDMDKMLIGTVEALRTWIRSQR